MSQRRTDPVAWLVKLVCMALVAIGFLPALRADDPPPSGDADVAPAGELAPTYVDTWTPWTPSPVDPGAIRYEELLTGSRPPTSLTEAELAGGIDEATYRLLGAETREGVDDVQAFAEQNGYAVHQAWSRYSAHGVEEARVSRALHEAGLEGFDEVGVTP